MHKYETKVTNDIKQDKGRGNKLWDNINKLRGKKGRDEDIQLLYDINEQPLKISEMDVEIKQYLDIIYKKHKNDIIDIWNEDSKCKLQNQCARILTKSPRREHITPVLKKLHCLKIQDRIIYKMLMLTYKSYYNMAPPYLCELINKKQSHVNTRLGTDHHQLIMPPISKDCSNTFPERSFIYAAPCEWNKF